MAYGKWITICPGLQAAQATSAASCYYNQWRRRPPLGLQGDSGSLDLETPQSETASAASPRSPLDALDEALGRVVASTTAVASR